MVARRFVVFILACIKEEKTTDGSWCACRQVNEYSELTGAY